MKNFFSRFISSQGLVTKHAEDNQLKRRVTSLFGLYSGIIGSERVVLKAGKLDAINLLRSENLPERVLALQKLVFEDPTLNTLPSYNQIPAILDDIEDELADLMARRAVEEKIEKKIAEKMEERHQEYVREIKIQVLKEEDNSENSANAQEVCDAGKT